MSPRFLTLAAIFSAACSSNSEVTSDEANLVGRPKVSGFDFDGPKALPAAPSRCAFRVEPEESTACRELGGVTLQAADCRVLCSKPIARPGSVAGYDFQGYKKLRKQDPLCAFHREPEESRMCREVGGVSTQATQCKILCSKPIAPTGQVAGYDLTGFRIARSNEHPDVCGMEVSGLQLACSAAGGDERAIEGCGYLCSLPL